MKKSVVAIVCTVVATATVSCVLGIILQKDNRPTKAEIQFQMYVNSQPISAFHGTNETAMGQSAIFLPGDDEETVKEMAPIILQRLDANKSIRATDFYCKMHPKLPNWLAQHIKLPIYNPYRAQSQATRFVARTGIADDRVINKLHSVFLSTTNVFLKEDCLSALYTLGERANETFTSITRNLHDHPSWRVRKQCAFTLKRVGEHRNEERIQALIQALEDPSPAVKNASALTLGLLGPKAAKATSSLERILGTTIGIDKRIFRKALQQIDPNVAIKVDESIRDARPIF